MCSQCPPVVCKIEVQQACAPVRGSLRRLLALFRLSQTCLRLFVHVAENPNKAHVVPARWDQFLKPMPPFLYRYPNTGDNVRAGGYDPEDDDLTYL
jgi:hypothetical protein